MPRRNRNTSTRTGRRKNDSAQRERPMKAMTTDQLAARLVVAGLAPAVILHDSSVRVLGNVVHLIRSETARR